MIPVIPAYDEILGETCYPSLEDIPEPVDVVDCFRRPDEIPALAEPAIQIGAKVENKYIVLGGLQAGERIVTSGNFLIDSESKLKSASGGMGAPGTDHGAHK